MTDGFLGPFKTVTPAVSATVAAPKKLEFAMQRQQSGNWCWAAVTASVCTFYAGATAISQCQIATKYLGKSCCLDPIPTACDQMFTLELPLKLEGHLAGPKRDGVLAFDEIVREVDAGRVICCHIRLAVAGHFVAIIGYDVDNREIIVSDPAPTPLSAHLPYKGAATFPTGTWDESYLTI